MHSVNTYQDIETPEEIEEKQNFENIYNDLLSEYDPEEMGVYSNYKNWCRKKARQIFNDKKAAQEEEDD